MLIARTACDAAFVSAEAASRDLRLRGKYMVWMMTMLLKIAGVSQGGWTL